MNKSQEEALPESRRWSTDSEARAWLRGKRSMTNTIPIEPFETWHVRCAQADAAMCAKAYWILRAAQDIPGLFEEEPTIDDSALQLGQQELMQIHTAWHDGRLVAAGLSKDDALAAAKLNGARGEVVVETVHVIQEGPPDRLTCCQIWDNESFPGRRVVSDDDQEPPAAVYTFDITSDGDPAAAGITSYSNRVRVTIDHDPGGGPPGEDSFAEYLGECLANWFDGGRVWFDEARVIDEDDEEHQGQETDRKP